LGIENVDKRKWKGNVGKRQLNFEWIILRIRKINFRSISREKIIVKRIEINLKLIINFRRKIIDKFRKFVAIKNI
jgi:hypothetical protein